MRNKVLATWTRATHPALGARLFLQPLTACPPSGQPWELRFHNGSRPNPTSSSAALLMGSTRAWLTSTLASSQLKLTCLPR